MNTGSAVTAVALTTSLTHIISEYRIFAASRIAEKAIFRGGCGVILCICAIPLERGLRCAAETNGRMRFSVTSR